MESKLSQLDFERIIKQLLLDFGLNLVKTSLKMKLLSEKEITDYIACREWVGCAGGYSIQGRAKCFFPFIAGCYSNVIGLPLPSLIGVLSAQGYYKK